MKIMQSTRSQVRTPIVNVRMLTANPQANATEYEYVNARSTIQCSSIGSNTVQQITREEAEIQYWVCEEIRDTLRDEIRMRTRREQGANMASSPEEVAYISLLRKWSKTADDHSFTTCHTEVQHARQVLAEAVCETNARVSEMQGMQAEDISA